MPGTGSTYVRGLWLASGLSTASVITDVFRKRALEPNEFYSTCFRLRVVATFVFGVALGVAVARHGLHPLHSIGPLMGVAGAEGPAWVQFLVYMLIDTCMVAAAQLLYFRALQTSEMSYFLPFVGLTPVLLLPTGFFLIGELPLPHQIAGVLLIVSGSLAMNGNRLQLGWRKFLAAPFERRASRYALIIALLFALSNPVDKVLVEISDPLMYAFVYNLCLCVLFAGLTLRKRTMLLPGVPGSAIWIVVHLPPRHERWFGTHTISLWLQLPSPGR